MLYHPADTCQIYKGINKSHIDQLWYKVNYFQFKDTTGESKKDHVELSEKLELNIKAKTYLEQNLEQRSKLLLKQNKFIAFKVLRGKLSGRLVHGLGGAHVRETAITIHPVYGIPYIPGSSIKGAVLNWAVQAFFMGDEKIEVRDDLQEEAKKLIGEIFGSQEMAGRVEFFDAFADTGFNLVPDIMTPHFGGYYSKGETPSDSDKPVPVAFYTLESDYIEFIIGVKRKKRNSQETEADILIDLIEAWTMNALKEMGIGSKTSSGYGYFSEFTDVTERVLTQSKSMPELPLPQESTKDKMNEESEKDMAPAVSDLASEIRAFKDEDVDKSKTIIYQRVLETAEQGDIEPAKELKRYWQSVGEWKSKGKKQKIRVQAITDILKE